MAGFALQTAAPSTQAGVGLSTLPDARAAGAQAARAAGGGLTTAPACVLVFATAGYRQDELLAGVRSEIGSARLVGCSGEGVISGPCSDERDHVVTVMALASTAIGFEVLARTDYGVDPAGCGRGLAADLAALAPADVFAVLLFADGLTGHCTNFLAAFQAALPPGVTVVGGTAGDCMEFTRTYQYAGDQVTSGGVSALVLRGAGRAQVAVSHGCLPIGLERTVTSAADGWLHTIDGRPAWSVFKEYLDGDPVDLNAEGIVHLCFGELLAPAVTHAYDPFIIRTPLQLDAATGALFFPGGGFVTGQRVRMTRRDPGQIRSSAEQCAATLADRERPAFVLQFDCAGRGRILFGACAADEIVRPLQIAVGAGVPWAGFHTYGEIAPVGDTLYYHNYTVALCAVYDAA